MGKTGKTAAPDRALRALIYVRRSRVRKGQAEIGEKQQYDYCARKVREKGWTMVKPGGKKPYVYDPNRTGRNMRREGIEQVRALAQEGEFDVLMTYDVSRLARNTTDGLLLVEELKDQYDVDFFSQGVEGLVNQQESMYKLMLTQLFAFAAYTSDQMKERAEDTVERRAKKNLPSSTYGLPVGLVWSNERQRIVAEPTGAKLVRRIFELYEKHGTLTGVARELNSKGVAKPRGAQPWTAAEVRRTLLQRAYTGEFVTRKEKRDPNNKRKPIKDELVIDVPTSALPIRNMKRVERVQERVLAGYAYTRSGKAPRHTTGKHWASGILYCSCRRQAVLWANFGVAKEANGKRWDYVNYRCSLSVQDSNHPGTARRCVAGSFITDVVVERFVLAEVPRFLSAIGERRLASAVRLLAEQRIEDEYGDLSAEQEEAHDAVQEIQSRIDRLNETPVSGVSQTEYERRSSKLDGELEAAERRVKNVTEEELVRQEADALADEISAAVTADNFGQWWSKASTHTRQRLLRSLFPDGLRVVKPKGRERASKWDAPQDRLRPVVKDR